MPRRPHPLPPRRLIGGGSRRTVVSEVPGDDDRPAALLPRVGTMVSRRRKVDAERRGAGLLAQALLDHPSTADELVNDFWSVRWCAVACLRRVMVRIVHQ
jgi:hypothetical protein